MLSAIPVACSQDPPVDAHPLRDCTSLVWIHPSSGAQVSLTGSWNGWDGASVPVPSHGSDGWNLAWIQLSPGEYGYLVVEDGVSRLDDTNGLTTFRGEEEVSLLVVPDCSVPQVRVDSVESDDEAGTARVRATFLGASSGAKLDLASVRATRFDGTALSLTALDSRSGSIVVQATGLPRGKVSVAIDASDTAGVKAERGAAVAWIKPAARAWNEGVLYQIMTDRYRGDGGAVLAAPKTPGSRAGGTLDGVRASVEDGVFDRMGVTALWLSPVYENPQEAREGRGDGHTYEGYHGYWPVDSYSVEARLGGEAALHGLVEAAHRRGIRVLLDVVPNHVYETNPLFLKHQGDGWFHDGPDRCVCGDAGCGWDTHIETCWFTSYLPDYRYQNPEVMRMAASDAVWWHERFDIDGVRIDAVPMMPRAATRRMVDAMRRTVVPSQERFALGDVYTGRGQGGIDSIRYFLGPWGLNSAFDFPLMWAIRDAFAKGLAGFDTVESVLKASEVAFEGSGAVISRIIGNHDTTRFLSEAVGDAGGDPWTNPPTQPSDPLPYARQKMALALLLSLPGLPLIYYGDEVGLAGGSDPDCRRVMPSFDALSQPQRELRETVDRLGRLRSCSKALRTGSRVAVRADADLYAFLRDAGDGLPVLAVFSKATIASSLQIEGNVVPRGGWVDVLTGTKISVGEGAGDAMVPVDPMSVRILVRENDPCR